MANWDWLEKPARPADWGFMARVVLKAALLFALVNVIFAAVDGVRFVNGVTLYQSLLPARERLPFGEDDRAYNLSLNSVEAMFLSHEVIAPSDEALFRVFVLGDSSVWGVLLRNDETLSASLNAAALRAPDGREMVFYNLGHPVMSLTKDLMLLDEAMQHQPDMIVWLTTLESFPPQNQIGAPLVQSNPQRVRSLIRRYDLALNPNHSDFVTRSFWDQTIVGQRRPLADWLRLQLFGVMWAHTSIDQYYPDDFPLRTSDFEEDASWYDYEAPTELSADDLAFDVLRAGHALAGEVPVLLVNEPIFISEGENSDLRYNLWYPRWAYDQYRALYAAQAEAHGWRFVDGWDWIDGDEFTDSPVHLTPAGSRQLAEALHAPILEALAAVD